MIPQSYLRFSEDTREISQTINEILRINKAESQTTYEILRINEVVSQTANEILQINEAVSQQHMRLSESTKQYLKSSFVQGNSSEKTPFRGDLLAKLCMGKTHKRLFRVTFT